MYEILGSYPMTEERGLDGGELVSTHWRCKGNPTAFKTRKMGALYLNNGADVEHPLHVPPRSPLMGGGAAGCRARMAAAPTGTWSLPAKARPLTSSRTSLQALRRGGRGMGGRWHSWKRQMEMTHV